MKTQPNHALQRTRHVAVVCNRGIPWAGSLSLGRSAAEGAGMDERREDVEIDLSAVTTPGELHALLARSLDFPDFYGRNWAAFWDAITGLVPMPRRLRLVG